MNVGVEKENLNTGTLGHVDHGKTTLTLALASIAGNKAIKFDDLDKAPEEKQRGITINTAHVEYNTEKRRYSHVDCPGHKDYIKNAITGAAQMDCAVLVVSVTDGVMPQTKEHILLAKQESIKDIIVFVNKWDTVGDDEESQALAEMTIDDIRSELTRQGFDGKNTKVIKGSAKLAQEGNPVGIAAVKELLAALDSVPTPQRSVDKPVLMAIEDVTNIPGRGTVVTGRIEQGTVIPGEYELVGIKPTSVAVVTSIETFRRTLPSAAAGDNVGLLLRGVKKDEVMKGQVLAAKGSIKPFTKFKAEIYLSTELEGGRKKPVFTGYKPQFYCRTANITGKLELPEGKEMLMPGETCTVIITLEKPLAINEGARFLMREGGISIGPGKVIEILPDAVAAKNTKK